MNVHLDNISTAEPSVIKLGTVMYYHGGLSVMQEDWFAIFKVTLRVYIIRYDLSTISTELLIVLQPDLIGC